MQKYLKTESNLTNLAEQPSQAIQIWMDLLLWFLLHTRLSMQTAMQETAILKKMIAIWGLMIDFEIILNLFFAILSSITYQT